MHFVQRARKPTGLYLKDTKYIQAKYLQMITTFLYLEQLISYHHQSKNGVTTVIWLKFTDIFGGTYRLHLLGRRANQANNKPSPKYAGGFSRAWLSLQS
jgi:hypothetical protein